MDKGYEVNIGKFIIPFDERHRILEITKVYFQENSGVTWYECTYLVSDSSRSFNVIAEMEKYAIVDSLQEAQKISKMTVQQLIIDYLQSNKAIERLCRKKVDLKAENERLRNVLPKAIGTTE